MNATEENPSGSLWFENILQPSDYVQMRFFLQKSTVGSGNNNQIWSVSYQKWFRSKIHVKWPTKKTINKVEQKRKSERL